ncbi:MAG: response regulator [Nitrosarchaeum sp.]|nr:response regulator [Nitrosarchaeum sp.]
MGITAIIIEDDLELCEVEKELLELNDMIILAIGNNGLEAVELYQKFKPDIVLMDVRMPHYDGIYGLENIKKLDPKAKIIMVTAESNERTIQKINELKASALIFKPFDAAKLFATIDELFSKTQI